MAAPDPPAIVDSRRRVPPTNTALSDPRLAEAERRLGRDRVKDAVHAAQARVRGGDLDPAAIVDAVLGALPAQAASLHAVINASGVVLHTNLGRAPLSTAASSALAAAAGYVDVEFDLAEGRRAARGRGALQALLRRVPAAQDALVVNNGAAALVLAATALAGDRDIVVSRGELIEIGDGFRLPELLESTGARLREVGTTNRTTLADYAAAVDEHTGFVLKVHPSNFVVTGFVRAASVHELSRLGVPVVADIGSGLLEPMPELAGEPDAATWLADGATIVIASGDKLLGGPQAGLVLGAADAVHSLRRHPLHRALRVDKLTLAALEATLIGPITPTRAAILADAGTLRDRAVSLTDALRARGIDAAVRPSDGLVGGGGAPAHTLPGWAVELAPGYATPLRTGVPAVVTRVAHERCLLDLRCVPAEDDERLLAAILAARHDPRV
jgi:L-seryl-tRNA(Ser) seleniumtransferase